MQARFEAIRVKTTAQMYDLTENAMWEVFGAINGNRWWHLIRGHHVDLPPTTRGQIGHSSVLEPKMRTPEGARAVAFRLLEKAAERLRSEGFHAGRLTVAVGSYREAGWSRQVKFQPCNSTSRFLQLMTGLWQDATISPNKVEIALRDLTPDREVTKSLFDDGKASGLDFVIDSINRKHGRGTVTTAAAQAAVDYLAHDRIPFGKPTGMR
jgi:DNA polymerase IV